MKGIQYINRQSGEIETEEVWKEGLLQFFYGPSTLGKMLLYPIAKSALFSKLVGSYQRLPRTKKAIAPFVQQYKIDPTEFLQPEFDSFNDFFIRKLKKEARPIASSEAVIPADGRFLFFENLHSCPYIAIKGKKYSLSELIGDDGEPYREGSAVIGRLCPSDYHRFHFPIDCIPQEPKLLNGSLFSVNPIALRVRPTIFYENKRIVTKLRSKRFKEVLMIEFGATSVGSITETFTPHQPVRKGDEKGYFSFGGSALMLLFQKGTIAFSPDLLNRRLELRCLLGQPLGN